MIKIIIVFLIASNLFAQKWQNFTTENSGLPSNNVTSLTVVENVVWFTTDNGLASFDGQNWNTYTNSDGLPSNYITSSTYHLGVSDNILLIGTDQGSSSFNIDNSNFISNVKNTNLGVLSILSDNILSITSDHHGNSWLGTDSGISIISLKDSVDNLSIGMSGVKLGNNQINSISVSADTLLHKNSEYIPPGGVVYAATNGGGVGRFYYHEVDGITSASIVENMWSGLPSDTVLSVYIDDKNNHWYGTTNGLASHFSHDSKNANWELFTESDGLVSNYITSVTSDNITKIFCGTINGLSIYDGNNWQSYRDVDGLVDNRINDISYDASDNLWIATQNGVSKMNDFISDVNNDRIISDSFNLDLETYPNPFNIEVNLKYSMSQNENGYINIYNSLGELVRKFNINSPSEGSTILKWNGRDSNNIIVNSGVYFVTLGSSLGFISKKIVVLK